jgi:nucleoside-diphosphate-sugar epimerase
MRVLVTGAEGFVGRHLIEVLRDGGHAVTATARTQTEPHEGIPFTAIELGRAEAWRDLVVRVRPDAVVHLAGLTGHPDPGELYRVNVVGTEVLLQAIASVEGVRPSVLLASTSAVYGDQTLPLIDETAPTLPVSHYGLTKLAMEQVARLHAATLPIRIVRPFNVIGRGQNEAFLIPKVVAHFVKRAPSIELGNLKPERDFIDVRDAVEVLATLTAIEPVAFDVVNLCSGVGTSVERIVTLLSELTGHELEVRVNPAFVRKNETWRIVGDNRKVLGLTGRPLRFTLRETLLWMVGRLPRPPAAV